MRRRTFLVLCLSAVALATNGMLQSKSPSPVQITPPKIKVGLPYTHGNLTVFFIHGSNAKLAKPVLTLKEAMEKDIVVVHETSNVNCLSIENVSADVEVFVMAGDVVKGGKQDRAIAFDIILPSKSGTVPLPSFCVEHGRWTKRGAEHVGKFGCSDCQVCSKELKIAVNEARQQGEVWKEVDNAQKKLSDNVGKRVNNEASPSSLQLSLEDKDVQAKVAEYEKALIGACTGKEDVVGVAVVVNGVVSSADVFGSTDLFQKIWPKLLKSAATEALSEMKNVAQTKICQAENIEAFFAEAAAAPLKEITIASSERGGRGAAQTAADNVVQQPAQQGRLTAESAKASKDNAPKVVNYRARILQYTAPKTLLIESHDKENPSFVWHRCYIQK